MKKSILTIIAIGAMISCEKKETTHLDHSTDSSAVANDSSMMVNDSDNVAPVAGATTNALTDQDKKFADVAATGGMMEVMMGELAQSQATDASVKALGAMMVKDHSKANEELKSWATTVGYTLPNSLKPEQQKMHDDLKAKKGADFDKAYADAMVTDHKKDIAEFKKQVADGGEASLKSFASKTVPTLEHHLMESEKAKTAVK
ncbi:hypothetical protein D3C87_691210 [compost metagenome]